MKGTLMDLMVIMIIFLASTILFGVVYYVGGKITEGFNKSGIETEKMEKLNSSLGIFVNGIPYIIVCFGISAIILAFMIPSHPAFMPISFILLCIFVFLSTIFTNIFWNFAAEVPFTAIFNEFPLVVWLWQNLPKFIAVLGVLIMVVQYGRLRSSSNVI